MPEICKQISGPKRKCVYIFLFFLALIFPSVSHGEGEGTFTFVKGRVDLLRVGEKRATAVIVGDKVNPGDIIRTKRGARAKVRFIDGSRLSIVERSRIVVKDFSFEPEMKKRSAIFINLRGKLRSIVSRLFWGKDSRFEVHTPTAVAAARGTDYITVFGSELIDSPPKTDIFVIEGKVSLRSVEPELPYEIILSEGQTSSVSEKRPPAQPRRYTPAEIKEQVKEVSAGDGKEDIEKIPEPEGAADVTEPNPAAGDDNGAGDDAAPPIDVPVTETKPVLLTVPVQLEVNFPEPKEDKE